MQYAWSMQLILAPVLYVVLPFSVWSSSFVLTQVTPITPDITVAVLSFLPSPTLSTCRNRLIFRLIAFCMMVFFLATRLGLNVVSFVDFCVHYFTSDFSVTLISNVNNILLILT